MEKLFVNNNRQSYSDATCSSAKSSSIDESEELNIINNYIEGVEHHQLDVMENLYNTVEELANKGIVEAEFAIGYGYYKPYFPNIARNDGNFEKAEYWLLKAADKSYSKAMIKLADIYYATKEYENCIKWAKPLAVEDDIEAVNMLSLCYNILKDNTKYAEELKKAAAIQEQSGKSYWFDPAYKLGLLYYEGNIVAKDLQIAAHWFTVAMNCCTDISKRFNVIHFLRKVYLELDDIKMALKISKSQGANSSANSARISEFFAKEGK